MDRRGEEKGGQEAKLEQIAPADNESIAMFLSVAHYVHTLYREYRTVFVAVRSASAVSRRRDAPLLIRVRRCDVEDSTWLRSSQTLG